LEPTPTADVETEAPGLVEVSGGVRGPVAPGYICARRGEILVAVAQLAGDRGDINGESHGPVCLSFLRADDHRRPSGEDMRSGKGAPKKLSDTSRALEHRTMSSGGERPGCSMARERKGFALTALP
jgi:hypothetical protein